ncbi:hypothetical protein ACK3YF_04710 [Aeromonas allosaccharophila]|uniref:hypothetical protein n=1 Tax=Aeromonas allosaccharophila TaxID=656 RepID=UPI0039871E97
MARLFLNQPMITSLPRTRNGVGIHRKPAKIGFSPMFERQAGKRRNMVVYEYHGRDHSPVCDRALRRVDAG